MPAPTATASTTATRNKTESRELKQARAGVDRAAKSLEKILGNIDNHVNKAIECRGDFVAAWNRYVQLGGTAEGLTPLATTEAASTGSGAEMDDDTAD